MLNAFLFSDIFEKKIIQHKVQLYFISHTMDQKTCIGRLMSIINYIQPDINLLYTYYWIILHISLLYSYHPEGVLNGRCSVNKNDIFGFSVASYPRPRSDLEKGPTTLSKKYFDKIQWKNDLHNRKKSTASHRIGTCLAFLSPSAICELFCLTRYSHFIIQSF